jgi:hypothetical protein
MGTPRQPKPVRLFTSMMFKEDCAALQAEQKLVSLIGGIREKTVFRPFSHTTYYEKEMGVDLLRCFLLFEPLWERDCLPKIKLITNEIEHSLSEHGQRRINIDPGYLSLEHVMLATTKGFAHRVYLGEGIFADLTLIFKAGTFRSLPWTYPDYGDETCIAMFNRWREAYKEVLKTENGHATVTLH